MNDNPSVALTDPEAVKYDEIAHLVSNREAFNSYVYTPLDVAIEELNKRQEDEGIKKYNDRTLIAGIPSQLKDKKNKYAVLFRQISTPNYEVRRFLSIIDALGKEFTPFFFEYFDDKFTDNNEWKHSLCKMLFYSGKGKKGGLKIDRMNIVDFNAFKGKKLAEITTIWGQKLTEFHRELIHRTYSHLNRSSFFDASSWFAGYGGKSKDYYYYFLLLFLKDGILFENFMLDVKEMEFTKKVFLPAFMKIVKDTGKKPLIVALEPTDIEGDLFWMCHPYETLAFVKDKFRT